MAVLKDGGDIALGNLAKLFSECLTTSRVLAMLFLFRGAGAFLTVQFCVFVAFCLGLFFVQPSSLFPVRFGGSALVFPVLDLRPSEVFLSDDARNHALVFLVLVLHCGSKRKQCVTYRTLITLHIPGNCSPVLKLCLFIIYRNTP